MGLSYEEFDALFRGVKREAIHLETRDSYGTQVEIPHLAKWAAGEPDDLDWLRPWCDLVRSSTQQGKSFRRARVVSEPFSEYQSWAYGLTSPMVEAGEDIRWVPRRLVSTILIPGNDFWIFDDDLVVFLLFAGDGLVVDRVVSRVPTDIRMCRTAFERLWPLAISHNEYQPV